MLRFVKFHVILKLLYTSGKQVIVISLYKPFKYITFYDPSKRHCYEFIKIIV